MRLFEKIDRYERMRGIRPNYANSFLERADKFISLYKLEEGSKITISAEVRGYFNGLSSGSLREIVALMFARKEEYNCGWYRLHPSTRRSILMFSGYWHKDDGKLLGFVVGGEILITRDKKKYRAAQDLYWEKLMSESLERDMEEV